MKNTILVLLGGWLQLSLAIAQDKDTLPKSDTSQSPQSSTITTSGNVNTGKTTNTGVLSADTSISVFILQALSESEKEIELGRIAQKKATRKDVKNFALKVIYDHAKANNDLTRIAQKKRITVPSGNDKMDVGMIANKEGAEFDKAFVEEIIQDHESTLSLFEKASETIKDAEIKAFAVKTIAVLKQHYEIARTLSTKLNGSDSVDLR